MRQVVSKQFEEINNGFKFGTIASKINVTPKGVYLPVSKLHSILTAANYLPIITKVKFVTACCQISWETPLGVTIILLAKVHIHFKQRVRSHKPTICTNETYQFLHSESNIFVISQYLGNMTIFYRNYCIVLAKILELNKFKIFSFFSAHATHHPQALVFSASHWRSPCLCWLNSAVWWPWPLLRGGPCPPFQWGGAAGADWSNGGRLPPALCTVSSLLIRPANQTKNIYYI